MAPTLVLYLECRMALTMAMSLVLLLDQLLVLKMVVDLATC